MSKLLYFIILISPVTIGCELTQEYREERAQFVKDAQYGYRECIKSVNAYEYWLEVSQCQREGRGANVGGGCAHIVGNSVSERITDYSHCDVFEVTTQQVQQAWEEYVEHENITRCLTSQPAAAGQPKAELSPAR